MAAHHEIDNKYLHLCGSVSAILRYTYMHQLHSSLLSFLEYQRLATGR